MTSFQSQPGTVQFSVSTSSTRPKKYIKSGLYKYLSTRDSAHTKRCLKNNKVIPFSILKKTGMEALKVAATAILGEGIVWRVREKNGEVYEFVSGTTVGAPDKVHPPSAIKEPGSSFHSSREGYRHSLSTGAQTGKRRVSAGVCERTWHSIIQKINGRIDDDEEEMLLVGGGPESIFSPNASSSSHPIQPYPLSAPPSSLHQYLFCSLTSFALESHTLNFIDGSSKKPAHAALNEHPYPFPPALQTDLPHSMFSPLFSNAHLHGKFSKRSSLGAIVDWRAKRAQERADEG
ncbi:hypothetical protein ADUPG1_006462 [Aduncisulcus paluster]|uniref:Uncharacterized protein n=1 Tax=Aduncisulcus paluster TaxID=2918883 RepID=A0ABQ5KLC4_9EUKA|nr:hypothetical protein ADUPG1_006462 [Aduncisulcus paluster]